MELDEITGVIVDASIAIHQELGPGLLEIVYAVVLACALERRGLRLERERPISFTYDGIWFEHGFRADLVVEDRVIVEVRSIERFAPVHPKQLLTYLRLMNLRVGLLLNFGAPLMRDGIERIVNDLPPSASPRLNANKGP